MELSYTEYTTIIKFATEGRKYNVASPIFTKDEYHTNASINDFISIECIDPVNEKRVIIYLLLDGEKYKATKLRHLLTLIKNISDIIIIAKTNITNIINKLAPEFNHLNIYVYPHYIFATDITRGPHCYPHRIMSRDEVNQLLNDFLYAKLIDFPSIDELDPQCIWIGAKIGDMIEIKSYSQGSGEVRKYCVVCSKSMRQNNKRLAELGRQLDSKEDEKNIDTVPEIDEDEKEEGPEPDESAKHVPDDVLVVLDESNVGTDDEDEEY